MRRRIVLAALASAVVGGGVAACRGAAPPGAQGATPARCTGDRDGLLRVRNFTGRVIEVYAVRPDHPPALLTQVSPGATELAVPGPADQAVRYDAIDPAAGQLLGGVTWLRPTSGGARAPVVLELGCTR